MGENKIVVSIQCLVYNHEAFLRKCLEGFVNQVTNFHYEAIIHDDASTDGSVNIIKEYAKEYPDIIKPIFQSENQYTKGGYGLIFNILHQQSKGDFIAICEGDDYWTDPYKLQKQVDVLKERKDISVVSGGYEIMKNGVKVGESCIKRGGCNMFEFDVDQWSNGWLVKTLTVLYRPEALSEYREKIEKYKYIRDIHLFYHLLKNGNGIYLSEILGAYNIHEDSACSSVPKNNNALYNYLCNRELYRWNNDGVTRNRLLKSINSRLVDRMPSQNNFGLLIEGLRISRSIREIIQLVFHFLFSTTIG